MTEDARPQDGVADGVDRQLDPRYIPLQQKIGWIVAVVMAGASFVAALILWASAGFSLLVLAGVAAGWVIFNAAMAWHAQTWPSIAYRHTSYRVDARGIEIRSGVYWRTIVNVPTSRVQHTDVSQGPLERTHGLGTLVIYTAGTDHSRVDLPGLAHERALQIREHLLPHEESDAV